MRLTYLRSLAVSALQGVSAFGNTSPFFLLSTDSIDISQSFPSLSSASTIQNAVSQSLHSCPSHYYLLISQPGATSSDYSSLRTVKKSMPGLSQLWTDKQSHNSRSSVNDVVGPINPETWTTYLNDKCKAASIVVNSPLSEGLPDLKSGKQIIEVTFPTLSRTPEKRHQQLLDHDAYISSLVDRLEPKGYTMLYYGATTQSQAANEEIKEYEMDESPLLGVLHTDLKRDLGQLHRRQENKGNQTIVDGPLFAKYQFFTPGIFMGGIAALLMLSIAYVGVSALSSLQVTYAAFDKEQGALAGKKTQ